MHVSECVYMCRQTRLSCWAHGNHSWWTGRVSCLHESRWGVFSCFHQNQKRKGNPPSVKEAGTKPSSLTARARAQGAHGKGPWGLLWEQLTQGSQLGLLPEGPRFKLERNNVDKGEGNP